MFCWWQRSCSSISLTGIGVFWGDWCFQSGQCFNQERFRHVLKCLWWSMRPKKTPLIFFISKSWAFHSCTSGGGWKMTELRTQLDQGDDFAGSLFPCFSIVMHFCSHLIPCRLIVKWLQNRTSRWFWWSELILNSLLAAANEHKAELNQGPKQILLEEFIFNVCQMKSNIFV